MAPPLLTLQSISLSFGGAPLLDRAELSIEARDRLCLVGRNGSGKSTLLKIAAGLIEPDAGERFLQPGISVRYLEQEPDMTGFATVLDYVEGGLHETDLDYRARYLLETFGMKGDEKPGNLSGGETRRAALARVLAPEPDILLLDEPTNHLDIATIEQLEAELGAIRSAIVVISHDRRFLTNLSKRTVWIDRGETRLFHEGFGRFEEWRTEVLEEEEEMRHKLDRKIVREEHWLTYGVTARRKRNQKRLADLHALRAEKRRLAERRVKEFDRDSLAAQESGASGKLVIEAEGIAKSYGERTLVKSLSLKINRKDRIGLVGPNGIGKTTLIRMLTGELAPDSGTVRLGTRLDVVSLDQKRESLDPQTSLQDCLTGGGGDTVMVGDTPRHVIGYMKDFLFVPEQARTNIDALSGGERGRLMLARAFARPSNLMVLDEPTNDLDLETLDLLQELINDYDGTVIIVSHDRDFLDRVVTSVLAAEGDGRWLSYAGGYSDMVAQRGLMAPKPERSAPKAEQRDEPRPSQEPAKARGKLSYKDKFALETLPKQMNEAEKQIVELETRLHDPDLYAKNPQKFAVIAAALDAARAKYAEMEDEWLRLELLREELEG
jgi:ATP-binding cassette subfamily F protein uup